jgi:hypothetical protein
MIINNSSTEINMYTFCRDNLCLHAICKGDKQKKQEQQ